MAEQDADLVILGGGSGGYACALRAAELGMSVVLVEQDKIGGTCLHRGCIPTKALLHAAEVADAAREGDQIGVKSSVAGIDMAGVNAYKDSVVGRLYKGLQGLVRTRGITHVEGEGRFVAPNAVEVDGRRYAGRHVVLATGSLRQDAARSGHRRPDRDERPGADAGRGPGARRRARWRRDRRGVRQRVALASGPR